MWQNNRLSPYTQGGQNYSTMASWKNRKKKENIDTDEIDQGTDNNDDDTDEENYAKAIQEQVIICDFSMFEWTVVLFYKWIKFCQSPFEN